MGMAHHGGKDVWVDGVAEDGDEGEEEEENEVGDKEDVGDDREPVGGLGELVQLDGDYACGHGYDEPSDMGVGLVSDGVERFGCEGAYDGVKFLMIRGRMRSLGSWLVVFGA